MIGAFGLGHFHQREPVCFLGRKSALFYLKTKKGKFKEKINLIAIMAFVFVMTDTFGEEIKSLISSIKEAIAIVGWICFKIWR